MVQFPAYHFLHLCIQCKMTVIQTAGLPHSATQGSIDVCSSPWLFAAYRGLLRRIAPRHPPWTLSRLTILSIHPSLCMLKNNQLQKKKRFRVMDQRRFELLTPALSERCSNQLSYWSVTSFKVKRNLGERVFTQKSLSSLRSAD